MVRTPNGVYLDISKLHSVFSRSEFTCYGFIIYFILNTFGGYYLFCCWLLMVNYAVTPFVYTNGLRSV